MTSHCERPGCTQQAEVLYGMLATALTVWLEPYDEVLAARVGALCRQHADAMVVPRGWSLDDRREAAPPLFRTEPDTPTAQAPLAKAHRRRPRRHATSDDTGQLELVPDSGGGEGSGREGSEGSEGGGGGEQAQDDQSLAAESRVAPEPDGDPVDGTPFSPWRPKFDEDDDLDGLLLARSPLLSRAFSGRSADGGKRTGHPGGGRADRGEAPERPTR